MASSSVMGREGSEVAMAQVWEDARGRRKSARASAGPMTWFFGCVTTSETADLGSGGPESGGGGI